jgi:hypothetical protein
MQRKQRTKTSTTMASLVTHLRVCAAGSAWLPPRLRQRSPMMVRSQCRYVDGKTARPVAGAAISLQSRDGQKVSKTTDEQGRVKIDGLASRFV